MANVTVGILQYHQEQIPEELKKSSKKAQALYDNLEKLNKIRSYFEINESESFLGAIGTSYVEMSEGAMRSFGVLCLFKQHLCYFEKIPPSSHTLEAVVDLKKHKKWKKFHIILDDQILSCYRDKKGFNVDFSIHLMDIHSIIELNSLDKKENVLQILTSSDSIELSFSSKEEMQTWNKQLNEKVLGHKPNVKFCIPLTYVSHYSALEDNTIFPHSICISTNSEDFIFNWVPEDFFALIRRTCDSTSKTFEIFDPYSSSDDEESASNQSSAVSKFKEKISSAEEFAFKKYFDLPSTETLLEVHSCSLVRGHLSVGQLFLSQRYLCFHSVLSTNLLFRYRDITEIEIEKRNSRLLTQAISITIRDQERYIFAFLRHRTSLVQRIKQYIEKDKKNSLKSMRSLSFNQETSPLAEFEHKSLSIKFLIIGSRGDVQPMIAFGLGLKRVGHKVTIATHEIHRSFVEKYGLTFASLYGDPKILMKISTNPVFSKDFWKDAIREYPEFITRTWYTCWEVCKSDTDVIIQNPPTLIGVHIAEKLQIPIFVAFTFPWTPTTTFPHPFVRTSHNMGPIFNYYSYIAIDDLLWTGIPGNSMMDRHNQFRKEVLKLKELPLTSGGIPKFIREQGVPTLYCWSPLILPKPKDWPENVHVCGYWFLETEDYTPPQELLNFLNQGPKPIYIGFGSVNIPNVQQVMTNILEALEQTNQRAILIKGWGGLGEGVTSERLFVVDNVPHDWLFPKVVACVHHGGAGTVSAALKAGIPSLVVPFFGDQPLWGDQIYKFGVGPEPIPIRYLNSKNLASAIQKMVTDKEMQEKASNLGFHIRSQDGVTRAVAFFHQELKKFPKEKFGIWNIALFTGTEKSSKLGKNSSLFLTFYGSRANSEEIEISPRHGFFGNLLPSALRGSEVRFLIKTPILGDLKKIKIRFNDKGILKHGFYLEKIEISQPNSNETISLPCKFWLSSKHGDKKVEREIDIEASTLQPQLST